MRGARTCSRRSVVSCCALANRCSSPDLGRTSSTSSISSCPHSSSQKAEHLAASARHSGGRTSSCEPVGRRFCPFGLPPGPSGCNGATPVSRSLSGLRRGSCTAEMLGTDRRLAVPLKALRNAAGVVVLASSSNFRNLLSLSSAESKLVSGSFASSRARTYAARSCPSSGKRSISTVMSVRVRQRSSTADFATCVSTLTQPPRLSDTKLNRQKHPNLGGLLVPKIAALPPTQ